MLKKDEVFNTGEDLEQSVVDTLLGLDLSQLTDGNDDVADYCDNNNNHNNNNEVSDRKVRDWLQNEEQEEGVLGLSGLRELSQRPEPPTRGEDLPYPPTLDDEYPSVPSPPSSWLHLPAPPAMSPGRHLTMSHRELAPLSPTVTYRQMSPDLTYPPPVTPGQVSPISASASYVGNVTRMPLPYPDLLLPTSSSQAGGQHYTTGSLRPQWSSRSWQQESPTSSSQAGGQTYASGSPRSWQQESLVYGQYQPAATPSPSFGQSSRGHSPSGSHSQLSANHSQFSGSPYNMETSGRYRPYLTEETPSYSRLSVSTHNTERSARYSQLSATASPYQTEASTSPRHLEMSTSYSPLSFSPQQTSASYSRLPVSPQHQNPPPSPDGFLNPSATSFNYPPPATSPSYAQAARYGDAAASGRYIYGQGPTSTPTYSTPRGIAPFEPGRPAPRRGASTVQQARFHQTPTRPSSRSLYCGFCKTNSESSQVYTSHCLRDANTGDVICPQLAKHVCEFCGATGTKAHTRAYCPQGEGAVGKVPLPIALKSTQRKSDGTKR